MGDFVELLAEVDLPASTPYSAFAKLYATDPRFLAVGEAEVREAAYSAHMDGLRSRQVRPFLGGAWQGGRGAGG
jgi:hypothetical protein